MSGYKGYANATLITGSIPSKSAATYVPTTSDQTIASGQYLSGVQTIKGDTNLLAENIAEGVSIFGVTGIHSGGSGGGFDMNLFGTGDTIKVNDETGFINAITNAPRGRTVIIEVELLIRSDIYLTSPDYLTIDFYNKELYTWGYNHTNCVFAELNGGTLCLKNFYLGEGKCLGISAYCSNNPIIICNGML